jgi:hypothetical protein
MTPLYWDTATSTPGKPPSWLTEVPRPMVRNVGFAGNAGGPSENAPTTPDRANYQPTASSRRTLSQQPRQDGPPRLMPSGHRCETCCGQSRRQAQAPGTTGRVMPGPSQRGFRLFFGAIGRTPHKEKGIFERMVFSIFVPYLVFFKGFSSGKLIR